MVGLARIAGLVGAVVGAGSVALDAGSRMDGRADASAGEVLLGGRYRLAEPLGEGGMGTVWRATDELLDRDVAVKRLRLDGLAAREVAVGRDRMLREARIAAKLHHPHVVSIFDVLDEGEPWLVLEYVPSRTLAQVLDERGPLVPAKVAAIGRQMAEALVAAHARGIVHRDIKPANVLLVDTSEDTEPGDQILVKITDWGISHVAGGLELTGTNIVSGTPAYFAPEVARGQGADVRSDVYALGATLHELLDGDPPFGRVGDSVYGLLARIGRDPVPPPRRGGPLVAAVARLTDTDPANRPSAAQARRMLGELSAAGAAVTRWTSSSTPPAMPQSMPSSAPPGVRPEAGRGTAAGPAAVPPVPAARRTLLDRLPGVRRAARSGADGPARPWWRRPAWLAGAGLLAALAVAVPVVLVAGTDDGPAPPAALGRIEIGDPATADPCSLVNPADLERFGSVSTSPSLGGLSTCITYVQLSADATDDVEVQVEFVPPLGLTSTLGGRQERLGEATLARFDQNGDRCRRVLLTSDGNRVFVDAYDFAESPVDLCAISEAATAMVINRLRTTGVGRRVPIENNSVLARLDACSLLTAAELAVVPGLDASVVYPGFGSWLCLWGDREGTEPTYASVEFGRTVAVDADDGALVALAGRQGRAEPVGDSCRTIFAQRSYASDGRDRVEAVYVYVYGTSGSEERCRLSGLLAAAVVPKLPAPS